jgi:MFS family permease
MKYITRVVLLLSLVSFFTDISSEMLYPVMPVYLRSIGFSVLLIGILEGLAEGLSGWSKGYFGRMSDNTGRRLPFVRLGYGLSSLAKPLIILSTQIPWVFSMRAMDRLGKGLRSAARDAVLAAEATPETKARVFGFHRGMDTLGAVVGPSLALLYLWLRPSDYKSLFLYAFIPAVLAVLLLFFIKEKQTTKKQSGGANGIFAFLSYWKEAIPAYRYLSAGLIIFALINSSDVFLLLRMKQQGLNDTHIIMVYIWYNLAYALLSFPIGILADKLGPKYMLWLGIAAFIMVYAGMAIGGSTGFYILLFGIYGVYAAATDGVSKAMLSNLCKKEDSATALGTFASFSSLATMLASALAGLLWYSSSPAMLFGVTACGAGLVLLYLLLLSRKYRVTA